jgi:hypothetical protein
MNRILLLGYLVLTALILVFVATVKDRMGSDEAQILAVILVALVVADIVLQRASATSEGRQAGRREK